MTGRACNSQDAAAAKKEPVVIKKYANRRLYNTETSTYVTLDDLATDGAVRARFRGLRRQDRRRPDALGADPDHRRAGEPKPAAQTLLPVPFLRQLIRFYDDSIGKMVPSYLQISLETLVNEQERFRSQFTPFFAQSPFGTSAFEAYQEQARKNLAMFEQAMKMWTPFSAGLPRAADGACPRSRNGMRRRHPTQRRSAVAEAPAHEQRPRRTQG